MRKKQRGLLLLPLGLALGTLALVFLAAGLFPLGKNTLVWGDFGSQVVPFWMQLKRVLRGEASALYNLYNASGMSFVGVLLYFLASPFSLLVAFVPDGAFYGFANLMVVAKLLTAVATATVFFAHRYAPFKVGQVQAGALGYLYAFGGFGMMYYQNNVWLDALYLLPLVAVALLVLHTEGRILPFAVALAALVVCQFQLAFMAVMALLLGGGLYVWRFAKKHQGGLFALRLGLGAGLAALLCAPAWLPALYAFSGSARSTATEDNFAGLTLKTAYETTLPMLLCTAAVGAAVLWLMWHRGWRQPKVRFLLILFALVSVPLLVEPINLMWHGGSYQGFPTRFGHVYLLVGLLLVAAALEGLYHLPEGRAGTAMGNLAFCTGITVYLGVLLYVVLFHLGDAAAYVHTLWGDKTSLAWGLVAFVAGTGALLLLFAARRRLQLQRGVLVLGFCLVALLGGLYNSMVYIGTAAHAGSYYTAATTLAGRQPAGRVKTARMLAEANTLGGLGYDSIAHYSSFTRQDMLTAYKKLGYSGYWMELSGFGGTLLSDLFLNISDVAERAEDGSFVWDARETYGLGALTLATPDALATLPEGDRFEAQEWLAQKLYGWEGPLFTRYEPAYLEGVYINNYSTIDRYGVWLYDDSTPGYLEYTIHVGERETLYFDCFRYISNSLEEIVNHGIGISVNGSVLEASYPNQGANGIVTLGTFENETVTLRIDMWRAELVRSFGVAGLPHSRMAEVSALVQGVQLEDGNAFVHAQEGQLLVLALGYDEGLTARVNGKSAALYRVLDGFVGIQLAAGDNQIQLGFTPRGLVPGLLLLLLGLCLVPVLLHWQRRRLVGPATHAEAAAISFARAALLAAGLAAFAWLYLWPLALWAEHGVLGSGAK